jgi:hypothetical protein
LNCKGSTLQKLTRALEAAGIQFIDEDEYGGSGVQFRKVARGKR